MVPEPPGSATLVYQLRLLSRPSTTALDQPAYIIHVICLLTPSLLPSPCAVTPDHLPSDYQTSFATKDVTGTTRWRRHEGCGAAWQPQNAACLIKSAAALRQHERSYAFPKPPLTASYAYYVLWISMEADNLRIGQRVGWP